MQIDEFWSHWQVREDPFRAEEARHDPVFIRLSAKQTTHPDFEKVFGDPGEPSSAVVFGEKGSGKTALRLLLEQRIASHNQEKPERRAWVARYDDLNPILDRFASHHGVSGRRGEAKLLERFRLVDHQDAILSEVTTELVDSLLGENDSSRLPADAVKRVKSMRRDHRLDLATLAVLYDQPHTGKAGHRWRRLRQMLRLNRLPGLKASGGLGVLFAVVALGLGVAGWSTGWGEPLVQLLFGLSLAGAILLLGFWLFRTLRVWWLVRKIDREMRTVGRTPAQLRPMLGELSSADVASQPLPLPGDHDSRYQLTARLLGVLREFGYTGLIVLVDRVDEPALINGDAEKMKSLIWPMLNNKFLQQERVGIKLLLPIELRHLLTREDSDFFQRARLDKQHMIDRLVWSGETLYDLCSRRLQSCRGEAESSEPITLAELFDEDVMRQDLIDALDQMQQPRDAFKFLYQVIKEHCSNVPHDQPAYRIPRLVLQQVRKQQSQRLQELQRGLSPA